MGTSLKHGTRLSAFLMDEQRNLQLADQYWSGELKGSRGIARYYRRVARVSHYKTGAQLEAEWQQAQVGKSKGLQ